MTPSLTTTTSITNCPEHTVSKPRIERTSTSGGNMSIRDLINSARRKSRENTNKPSNISSESLHTFLPPLEGDSRGPCPALNTLANHGYLPRNGQNITPDDLLTALRDSQTYNLSDPLARFLVYGGWFMMRKPKTHSISLHELSRHGLIEHNASIVHKDTTTGKKFAPTRCDTKLLDGFLNDDPFEGPLTVDMVAKKRVALERVSPLDPIHQEVARGEWALVLGIFGRAHGGKVSCDSLRVWLKKNQFPEEWRPTHKQGLFATMAKSTSIRRRMNYYRKHHKVSLGHDGAEIVLTDEPKATPLIGVGGQQGEEEYGTRSPAPSGHRRITTV